MIESIMIFHCKHARRLHKHSLCLPTRRKWAQYNLDIWVLRLRQGQMQIFLRLKVGKGLDFQKGDLNGAHETERTVFPIPQVFGMCRRRL